MPQRLPGEVAEFRVVPLALQLADHHQRQHHLVLGEPAERAGVGQQDGGVQHDRWSPGHPARSVDRVVQRRHAPGWADAGVGPRQLLRARHHTRHQAGGLGPRPLRGRSARHGRRPGAGCRGGRMPAPSVPHRTLSPAARIRTNRDLPDEPRFVRPRARRYADDPTAPVTRVNAGLHHSGRTGCRRTAARRQRMPPAAS